MRALLLLLFSVLLSGCQIALIYKDVTKPLVVNMGDTPIAGDRATSRVFTIKEPISAARVAVEWNSKGIGDAAKRAGFQEIYFADLRVQSAVLGIWKRETVQVWGVPLPESEVAP